MEKETKTTHEQQKQINSFTLQAQLMHNDCLLVQAETP